MNKEELIKSLEYTEEKHRKMPTLNTGYLNIPAMCSDVIDVLKNCIEIPEGATNGDMVKALFPNVEIRQIRGTFNNKLLGYRTYLGWRSQDFLLEWWDAPFKIDKKEDQA